MTHTWLSGPSLRRTLGFAVLLGAALLALGVVAVYRARDAIGSAAVAGYLRSQGVPAKVRLDRLDASGFSGSAILGPAGHPDLTVDRIDGRFAPNGHGTRALLPKVIALTLQHPQLHASYDGRHVSFGSLQGLITSLGRSKGGGPAPDVTIRDGVALLTTPWGNLTAQIDGETRAGHVANATVRLTPSRLKHGPMTASSLAGVARLQSSSAQDATIDLHVTAAVVAFDHATAHNVDAAAHFHAPAGALLRAVQSGRLQGEATILAATVEADGAKLVAPKTLATLDGLLHLEPSAAGLTGRLGLDLSAASGQSADANLQALSAKLSSRDLNVSWRAHGLTAASAFTAAIGASHGQWRLKGSPESHLKIEHLEAAGGGRATVTGSSAAAALSGSVVAEGGMARPVDFASLLGRSPEMRSLADTLQQSARDGRLEAQQVALDISSGGYRLVVSKPVSVRASNGMTVRLSPLQVQPLAVATNGVVDGAFQAQLDGAGLPGLTVRSASYHVGTDAEGAAFTLKAEVDGSGTVGPYLGASVSAAATIARRQGVFTVTPARCAALALQAYQPSGAATLKALKAQLCPGAGPWFSQTKGGWAADASLMALSADLPAATASLEAAEGRILVSSRDRAPPQGLFQLRGLALKDNAVPARVKPLTASGQFTLANNQVHGDLAISLADAAPLLGHGAVTYDLAARTAQVILRVEDLKLVPGGLQPAALSPLLARWISNARGDLSASAELRLADGRLASQALLKLSGLDFKSPAGVVTGLKGAVAFSSLAPLTAEPGQVLTADRLASFIPLTQLRASFGLTPKAFILQSARAAVANGSAGLSPMQVPLAAGATVTGALTLTGVDLQPFIDSTNLSNAVSVQARMNGVLPFSLGPGGLRFANGALAASGPGRLTIHRQALTGAVATAGSAGAQPNAVQDFAYQALEDLAFESLSAEVASRPEGRLGMLLKVKGRHDPPAAAPTRLSLIDLARGRAFDKPIPLPKGTPVDLTLDGSLNFDELMAAYSALSGEIGSAKVQPKP